MRTPGKTEQDPASSLDVRRAFRFLVKKFASIEIAVVVILLLGSLTAWGTFVEAAHNSALAAAKIVYHSVWMYSTLGLLCVSLIAVMIDRWPWQEKHVGFVLAHIGILILLGGSLLTKYYGVDGSITLEYGKPARQVISSETDFTVYASLDGASYRKLFDKEVDFFSHRPTAEKPLQISIPGDQIQVVEYLPYAYRDEKIVESKSENVGAAVRFQLQNDRVNLTDWLLQPADGRDVEKDLGPAKVVLAAGEYKNSAGKNALVLRPRGGDAMDYEIHTARTPGQVKKGTVKAGEQVETGWMGLVLRVLKYMPHAENKVSFVAGEKQTEMTTAAVKVKFLGRDQWLALNGMLKLFTNEAVYVVSYANRALDLGFDIDLQKFNIGRNPGTLKAASYESIVNVPNLPNHVISMNEPLKYNGFTLYQASFQEDESGRPYASVLSVNRDPGRWVKYFGSFLIVLGSIHLFWFKRKSTRGDSKQKNRAEEKSA
jgi:hypothetical protein